MIKNVKVSLQAVKQFEQSVIALRDYSAQFDKAMVCFEDYQSILSERIDVLRECIENMEAARNRLAEKIKEIESELAGVTAELNDMEERLSYLKNELSKTSESFSMIDEEGERYEVPNPAYTDIKTQISVLKSELREVISQRDSLQCSLNQVNIVDGQLASQIDFSNNVIYILREKQNYCWQYRNELEEIKNLNFRNGTNAVDNLKRIENIIKKYLGIKMSYEKPSLQEQNILSQSKDININININKNVVREDETVLKKPLFSEEDIKKHQILFDNNGRIIEYDNKTFGGRYNSYGKRLERTMADDNPILGHYEGERGESKYIPSGRTAEGVTVIGILNEYGLDGIEYRNAEPDFEVCSEAVVKIKKMSKNRENYYQNGIQMPGNFTQADIECAKLWNEQKRDGRDDWTGRDVMEYRHANKLTWHEKCDMETMVLVRTEINSYFIHIGGCSECKIRDGEDDGGGFDE